jgi:hypothetical protein
MSITSIAAELPVGVAGQLDDSALKKDVVPCTNNEATAGILPGTFVVIDDTSAASKDDGVLLPAGATKILKALALFGHSYSPGVQIDASTGAYLPGITFDGLRTGRARAIATAAMTPTDHVHVQMVANTGKPVGTIRPDADTGKSVDATDFIRVVEGGDATTPPVVEVDLNMAGLATAD